MTRVIIPISLPKELNLQIEKKVKQGHYASKSEYVRKVIREDLAWKMEFERYEKRAIAEGLKAIERGEYSKPFKNAKDAIKFLRGL